MLKASLIIPMPPTSTAPAATGESKPLVGLYPCLADDCNEYGLVMLDNAGMPYVSCSPKNVTIQGCKRRSYGNKSDLPDQTQECFHARFEAVTASFPMGEAYRQLIMTAWEPYITAKTTDMKAEDNE